VLLLRALGIPARYAAGFSAQEYSALERAFIVRNRHAHAWVTAFIDGRWVEMDTTPAAWAEFEAEESRAFFGPVLDFFSWVAERAVQHWAGLSGESLGAASLRAAGIVLGVAGLAACAWWLRKRRGRSRGPTDAAARAWKRVESRLAQTPHARAGGETAREWAERLLRERPGEPWRERLAALARSYYAVRFDPGASPDEMRAFLAEASRWIPPAPRGG
jgi:hypothetical protein